MSRPRGPMSSTTEESVWTDVTGVFDRAGSADEDSFESTWERPVFRSRVPQSDGVRALRPSSRIPTPMDEAAPAPAASIVGSYARLIVDYALERGADVELLAHRFGIEGLLEEGDARVSFDAFRALCDALVEELGEPDLGLNAGRRVRPGHFGTLGFALTSCGNARQFIDRTVRYSALVHDGCRNEIEECDGKIVWRFLSELPGGEPLGRVQNDLNVTMWITLARWIFDATDQMPAYVTFQHRRPENAAAYASVLGPNVCFGAPFTAIAFDTFSRDRPLASAHDSVSKVLDSLCEGQLEALLASRNAPFLRKCADIIASTFETCEPRIDHVSERLGMSVRELRRRLAEFQTEYRVLVNQVRFEVARRQLLDPDIGIAEIAYTLGFSQQSAFQRAFKRWTGVTPGEFRRRRNA
jgi:AraC-like DNA-binding protein